MLDKTIDGILEATFMPHLWPEVLGDINKISGTMSGHFMCFTDGELLGFASTTRSERMVDDIIDGRLWEDNLRCARLMEVGHMGFMRDDDILAPEELAADPFTHFLRGHDLKCGAATMVKLQPDIIVAFAFGRALQSPPISRGECGLLDQMRPHLQRAAVMTARLGFERARASVLSLEAVGMAAAVLRSDGRTVATNSLFDAMEATFRPAAFGRIAIADRAADAALKAALATAGTERDTGARSFIIDRPSDTGAITVHLLPLKRNARDLMAGGDFLLIASAVGRSAPAPGPIVLGALFGLTPAQARLAGLLAAGMALGGTAREMGITYETARSHLRAVFLKTGTKRQADLVALLKDVRPF